MTTTFKVFTNGDVVSHRTLLHEAIPITGSIVSGTYSGNNIKTFSHEMFQKVFDFPFLSSSANEVMDITVGFAADSALSGTTATHTQNAKKIQLYNQMAQQLVGHDITGSILKFDQDGNIVEGGTKLKEVIFLSFSRLLYKDEIKKGSFNIQLGGNAAFASPFTSRLTLTDAGAQNDFRVNSPAGEYGILSASAGGSYSGSAAQQALGTWGLIFYQAGVAVLTASVFQGDPTGALGQDAVMNDNAVGQTISQILTGTNIAPSTVTTNPGIADAIRHRIFDISFNNTTELNSRVYACKFGFNEFNYSSNPTYVSGSKIRVKNNKLDSPVSYVTTIGLYSSDNELMAVTKISEPIKKDPTQEFVLRARLDF